MEVILKIIEKIEIVISVISVSVVIYGAIIAVIGFIKAEICRFRGSYNIQRLRAIRADLGTYLLLGLELLIAADVLKTIMEPGTTELIILGGIVLLRTVLSVFLNREIREIDIERQEHPEAFSGI